ncbi:MAG: UDP-N-acetylmuramate dehydrogenase [Hyphomicrobiaceae bacterium]|nr:UDP-N-acetylmuramate dehydrogenase [Hyphomicrobiaceae bacterium]
MTHPDITADLGALMPKLRGKMRANVPLRDITWVRVGGPAQVLFYPVDEKDLTYFLTHLPSEIPIYVIGYGSNLLVRDGGLKGIVIRLGRGVLKIQIEQGQRLRTGAAVPDSYVARVAANAGISGLTFYRTIPGSVGGAVRMNAGAHGMETKNILLTARAVDRGGKIHILSKSDIGFSYRSCKISPDWIFTEALFQGHTGDPVKIRQEMEAIADYREQNQPIRERTCGSTFKNPPGLSAWKLVNAAGCRGLSIGGAIVSEKHCNFLINYNDATASDIEILGETIRERVKANSGIELQWEIVRIGIS